MESTRPTTGTLLAHGPAERPGRHRPHLDALRGVAALLVVLHHAYLECPPDGLVARATPWLRLGHFLVTFFILLSGYCLTLPTVDDGRLRGGLLDYAWRRARRLLPAYYAALAGSIALAATVLARPTGRHWDFALPVDARSALTHFLLIHNADLSTLLKINHVFWSIAVEWQIYFAFPILLWLARRLGIVVAASIALALGYAGYAQVDQTARFGLMPHYYGMFALGMLAAHVGQAPAWREATVGVSWWSLAGLALLAAFALGPTQSYELVDLPFGVACAAALVALESPGRLRRGLNARPMVALGGIAYSLYLVHAPLQHLLVVQAFGPLGLSRAQEFPALVLVGTPLILAASYGFHRAFERPFLPARDDSKGPTRPTGSSVSRTLAGR